MAPAVESSDAAEKSKRDNDDGPEKENTNNSNNGSEKSDIEAEIGPISGEYSCSVNHISGILYAGSHGVIFKGNIFFYQSHVHTPWKDVKKVQQTEQGHISLLLQDASEITFEWLDQSSDKVWATLVSLHHEFINGTPLEQPLLTPIRANLRRLSTDPIPATRSIQSPPTSGQEAAYVAAATVATMDDLRMLSARRLTLNDSIKTQDLTADLEEAWAQLNHDQMENYSEVAVEKQQIPCSLDKFFQLFFADDAPHPIATFMENGGDENLVISNWQTPEGGTSGSKSRTIEYSHPVNAPLAPPMARARKEQRIRRFGSHGISLETDTYVDDVPMTDCFYVTDRVLVAATDDNTVAFSAKFDIRFVKSTMFRAIIANTTRSEFLSWFQRLANTMVAHAGGGEPRGTEEKPTSKSSDAKSKTRVGVTPSNQPRAVTSVAVYILIVLVFVVVVTQFWILSEMSAMQKAIAALVAASGQVCPQQSLSDCSHVEQLLQRYTSGVVSAGE